MKKKEKARGKVWKCLSPLSAVVLLPTSPHVHVVLSYLSLSSTFFLSFAALKCKLKASLLPNFTPHSHPPMSWLHLFFVFHIFIPVALSLPHTHTHTHTHAHTHTHEPSSESYSRGNYFVQQRRRLTVPYVKFSLHCAPTFFCNWIISLAANPTSVVLGDFTTSYLPFTSVRTSTFCCLQL